MANEVHGILFANVESVSGGTYQAEAVDEESFLQDVVSPIYEVMRKVLRFDSALLYYCKYLCRFGEFLNVLFLHGNRKQKEIEVAKQVILHGETMMILTNTFGHANVLNTVYIYANRYFCMGQYG